MLSAASNPGRVAESARVGIKGTTIYGVSVPNIRLLARRIGRDPALAEAVWDSGVHEARQLAPMIADPGTIAESLLEWWVTQIDAWDICDGFADFVGASPFAWQKAVEWAGREEEFVRRAAFALIASIARHDRNATDADFAPLLALVRATAPDDRNFVKKAVNWALRAIGKRNLALNDAAIACAMLIQSDGTKSGCWIAADALRELRSDAVQGRLRVKPAGQQARS
jgi:3-methyladenine DNA glycosylase AlkD